MPPRKVDDLLDALRELQIKLAREIDRSRQLRERVGLSENELKATSKRMINLLARMRTTRTLH